LPIEEIERKWLIFLAKNEVSKDSWLYQMYEVRKIWCAAYHAAKVLFRIEEQPME